MNDTRHLAKGLAFIGSFALLGFILFMMVSAPADALNESDPLVAPSKPPENLQGAIDQAPQDLQSVEEVAPSGSPGYEVESEAAGAASQSANGQEADDLEAQADRLVAEANRLEEEIDY
jgi:hypothetical protein